MASSNFSSILSKPPSETERPVPLPQGSYTCQIMGLPRKDKSSKKQTEYVEFTYKILSAGEDVDAEELATAGGIAEKTIKDTYYLTEASLFRLKDMLANCGIDVDNVESYDAAIEETPGKQIGVFIRHEPSKDGQAIYANVGKTFLAE